MALPLLTRATNDDGTFVVLVPRGSEVPAPTVARRPAPKTLVPDRRPVAGEQYRFHIDMNACIGCKCCVVACNEQNGNPADINWRRVAEVEGGRFPAVRRAYVSMGCNHCADPTCLAGCPVDAYTKDAATGIVQHSADTCIGCQYCTWTCSYGVPQFNAERGVVGKCDMCHGRLALGQAPACVSACPEGAIGIEIVNVDEWRRRTSRQDGRPNDDGSLSTSRMSIPSSLPAGARPVQEGPLTPEHAHGPLVAMTVLTQLAAGAFVAIWLSIVAGASAGTHVAAATAFGALALGLLGSTLHLGRPIHAYRAMKMWRRSWLSREVVLFAMFAKAAAAFVAAVWLSWPASTSVGALVALLGLAGVAASAFIYQVPSRPLWHSPRTFVQFFATTLLLGSLFAAAFGLGNVAVWRALTVATAVAMFLFLAATVRTLAASPSAELRSGHQLLTGLLRRVTAARAALLVAGGVLLPALSGSPLLLGIALLAVTAGELAGRYLFFAAAVPRHMSAPYLSTREAA